MKIFILNESKQQLGGGFSFIRNFKKGMAGKAEIVDDWTQSDIVLIPSATMAQRESVEQIKAGGKKIVLRLDNIPRNSRNRGAGTSRLFDMAQAADAVIYQSEWARGYLKPFLKRDGEVVYNGVDTDIFKTEGLKVDFQADNVYLYSRFNRDETKGWERAWYQYQMFVRSNAVLGKTSKLVIVGQYSDELRDYGFDFFNGEQFEYVGIVEDAEYMAKIMRGCQVLLAPYYNDCFSNTILEGLASGLNVVADLSGGTNEMLELWGDKGKSYFTLDRMASDYLRILEKI